MVAIVCESWAHVGKENKHRAQTMSGQSTSLHGVSERKLRVKTVEGGVKTDKINTRILAHLHIHTLHTT